MKKWPRLPRQGRPQCALWRRYSCTKLAHACGVQLRHPNILQFKETAELEERGETVIYLVTEARTPLADHLQHLDIQVCNCCKPGKDEKRRLFNRCTEWTCT